jgi:hypothetical protein
MNFKLDYITRILKKTSHKRIENYVISRIWHQLNNDEIKMAHQQYVNLEDNNYALTDLFFPQINYHIEVNEAFHYKDEHKINLDKKRAESIINSTKGHIVRFINCKDDLAYIHTQIDDIVNEINELVNTSKNLGKFRPWEDTELTAQYWKEKKMIEVNDNINLKTIDEIGFLFDTPIKKRGFLKPGAVKYDKDGFSEIWWPEKKEKNNWKNDFQNDFEFITEQHTDPSTSKKHLNHYTNNYPNCKRIVFFKYKDELGFNYYKFVGCFKLNTNKSIEENKLVWERFSMKYELQN